MENVIEKKKNGVLEIITLVFAIVSACFFVLGALYSLGMIVSDAGIKSAMQLLFEKNVSFKDLWDNLLSSYLPSLLTPVLMIAAAGLIIIDRAGAFPFLPIGLLSKVGIGAFLATPINLIFNLIIARFVMPSDDAYLEAINTKDLVVSIAFTVIAVIIMATVFVFSMLLKKLRFIPMALLTLLFGAGAIVSFCSLVFVTVTNIPNYGEIFKHLTVVETAYNIWYWFVCPTLNIGTIILLTVACFFAIGATLPYKEK